ncbi:formate dehydrogenase accessory sulfurtransferase FdhD [Nostocoides sp. F2B08]|uniref:formate dehydrogenase accessory sulfurtransferase FdhD n=1 Tax=Nostocoides sp. F2B08 TaxID=2653936 RepID=UPI0012637810|nr:formate dehydrogenase accessory sulfurtransferase FdhD [Tetrasphaera sp. F2B08]KAB7744689.1 formate dehydrogenase accessory sulfurtransferase FdhD [Tetrasphaera sp. F2B08]
MGRVTARVRATRLDSSAPAPRLDRIETVAVEEPLQIRVEHGPAQARRREDVAVTMRTPGDDFDLALGHLITEGVLDDATAVAGMMHCTDVDADGSPTFNVVDVTLRAGAVLAARPRQRTEVVTSACGICGTDEIAAIAAASRYAVDQDALRVDPEVVAGLPDALRERQKGFSRTGGMHAAGIATGDGELLAVREDVGRHNAADKVIGWAAREGLLPLRGHVLVVSARASFELVQKAVMAGAPMLVAVSAPTSLAVDLAAAEGLTLVAFTRAPRCTVYTRAERLAGR